MTQINPSAFNINFKIRKDPAKLVDGALDMFKKAQEKMEQAEVELEKQIHDDQIEIDKLLKQQADSGAALTRAQRVRQRFADLLA